MTESWMVDDASPASFSTSHVKLAPLSSRRSRMSTKLDVVPNLTDVGKTVTPALSGAPLRYHVTFGAGFPPVDVHVKRMCSDSRRSRDDTLVETVGVPGVTAQCVIRQTLYSQRNLNTLVYRVRLITSHLYQSYMYCHFYKLDTFV